MKIAVIGAGNVGSTLGNLKPPIRLMRAADGAGKREKDRSRETPPVALTAPVDDAST